MYDRRHDILADSVVVSMVPSTLLTTQGLNSWRIQFLQCCLRPLLAAPHPFFVSFSPGGAPTVKFSLTCIFLYLTSFLQAYGIPQPSVSPKRSLKRTEELFNRTIQSDWYLLTFQRHFRDIHLEIPISLVTVGQRLKI